MDKVYIEGLTFQTTIGFYPWEKEIKQTLVVDLTMGWDNHGIWFSMTLFMVARGILLGLWAKKSIYFSD